VTNGGVGVGVTCRGLNCEFGPLERGTSNVFVFFRLQCFYGDVLEWPSGVMIWTVLIYPFFWILVIVGRGRGFEFLASMRWCVFG